MVSSQVLSTFGFLGISVLLPRLINWWRQYRVRQRAPKIVTPVPRSTSAALLILFLSASIAFLSTLPIFHPENIFLRTSSRLNTSGGVLMTRLAAQRPITPFDESLRAAFDAGGLPSRLLYARYGPNILADCTLADAIDPNSKTIRPEFWYLLYALPAILGPHLLHLLALGLSTSPIFATLLPVPAPGTLASPPPPVPVVGVRDAHRGPEPRWRWPAIAAGVAPLLLELALTATYDDTANERSVRVADVDFFHWRVLVARGLLIAAIDAALGWAIWAQATGRAWTAAMTAAERVAVQSARMEGLLQKTRSLGVLRNGVMRNRGLREMGEGYWRNDQERMREVDEDAEVVAAQRAALSRIDLTKATNDAGRFVDMMLYGGRPAPVPAPVANGVR